MELQATPTYIATVSTDHTVTLPPDMPVGAQVAIVLIPSSADEAARHSRFEKTLHAIREAAQQSLPSENGEPNLDWLIEQARKSAPAN